MNAGSVPSDLDPRAPLVDVDTFTLVTELELRRAIRLQYYVSLLVLQADFDHEAAIAERVVLHQTIAEVIRDQIRSTDVVSVMPSTPRLEVLLVSTYLDNLPAIIERIATAASTRALELEGRIARMTLSIGGACFPTTARERTELFQQAESLSTAARGEPSTAGYRYRLARRVS
jgi:GGDEF domain-containing protein